MKDPGHPEDALFFIAEADCRIYEAQCEARQALRVREAAIRRTARVGELLMGAMLEGVLTPERQRKETPENET
eukprot:3714044-Lingulodinium_polyedra.AAC.1